jgi:predicted acetylornithine/succinylornithine family transaminase
MNMATVMAPTPATNPASPPAALLPVYKRAPIEIVRGEGIRLFDSDGRDYVDFTSGIAVNALGYGDAALRGAMHEAADGLVHVSNLFRTAPGERLAERLVQLSFADRVFLCNSGVEANEGAFKFARRWARTVGSLAKHEIVGVRGSFHGRLFASLAATDRPAYRAPFRPLAGGVSIAERDLESLAEVLSSETVAALVLEPIQGEGGVRVFDPGYLRELRSLTRERRIALIFDEIQCGLGRTGRLFAHEVAGVTPDLMTLAKPIAGGLPMGAVLLTEEVATAIQPGDHGTTFGGGPFVSSVALHVLERVSQPEFLESVRRGGAWLGERLRDMAVRTTRIRDVRGTGFIWGLDVHKPAPEVIARARDEGLLLVGAGDYTLRILPPLVATQADLEEGLGRLERALG